MRTAKETALLRSDHINSRMNENSQSPYPYRRNVPLHVSQVVPKRERVKPAIYKNLIACSISMTCGIWHSLSIGSSSSAHSLAG
jgi:hypothetical protein